MHSSSYPARCTTSTPASSSIRLPKLSPTNVSGSMHPITTRLMPASTISFAQQMLPVRRRPHGSIVEYIVAPFAVSNAGNFKRQHCSACVFPSISRENPVVCIQLCLTRIAPTQNAESTGIDLFAWLMARARKYVSIWCCVIPSISAGCVRCCIIISIYFFYVYWRESDDRRDPGLPSR
jgi:hypothetical protein